jgi:hypothetical protein
MLDWSKFNKKILPKEQLTIELFFCALKHKTKILNPFLIKDPIGLCYPGGNASTCIIRLPNSKIGIKVYNNKIRNQEVFKFYKEIKNLIYKDNNYIQKVHDCFKIGETIYTIQEWIEGPTLEEIWYEKKFNYLNIKTILDDLYLKIIIPLWSQGLIWHAGSMTNFCLTNHLISIDNDNMYKTAAEIITNSSFNARDQARRKSHKDHSKMVHFMCSSIKENYNLKTFSELEHIYFNPIDSNWELKSIECYNSFLNALWI